MADHVPLGVLQILKHSRLRREFLHPILAEQALSCLISFADALRGLSLADCHQRDFVRVTSRTTCRSDDTLMDRRNVSGYRH